MNFRFSTIVGMTDNVGGMKSKRIASDELSNYKTFGTWQTASITT